MARMVAPGTGIDRALKRVITQSGSLAGAGKPENTTAARKLTAVSSAV